MVRKKENRLYYPCGPWPPVGYVWTWPKNKIKVRGVECWEVEKTKALLSPTIHRTGERENYISFSGFSNPELDGKVLLPESLFLAGTPKDIKLWLKNNTDGHPSCCALEMYVSYHSLSE